MEKSEKNPEYSLSLGNSNIFPFILRFLLFFSAPLNHDKQHQKNKNKQKTPPESMKINWFFHQKMFGAKQQQKTQLLAKQKKSINLPFQIHLNFQNFFFALNKSFRFLEFQVKSLRSFVKWKIVFWSFSSFLKVEERKVALRF